MANRVDKILNIFEKQLPSHYETDVVRTSQVQMALDIAEFLHPKNTKKILIIEAPVGTGKSLGAMIPALVERQIKKNRVLYATSTINLQGQLMNHEVPLLKTLKLVTTPLLAKGKGHYYCRHEFEQRKETLSKHRDSLNDFFVSSKTGHRDDFESRYYELPNQEWKQIALRKTMSECMHCRYFRTCPTVLHRNRFLSVENDLLITNQDQLIRSVLNVHKDYKPIVPIEPGIVIIDEAHDFLENFLGQLKNTLRINTLYRLKREFDEENLQKEYLKQVHHLNALLKKENSKSDSPENRFSLTKEIHQVLLTIERMLSECLYGDIWDDDEPSEIESSVNSLRSILDEDQFESWGENEEGLTLASISKFYPTEFRKMLETITRYNKIVVMSGTLSVNGDFSSMLDQWRLRKSSTITKSLPTPFDYSKQALIYVPSDLVPSSKANEPSYLENQLSHLKSLITTTDGRSLILTTSKRHMTALHEGLDHFLKDRHINLFLQENASVEQLTKRFKDDERSILIGSGSFFSGFSVPGPSLVSVIVTKLPFPVPSDPIIKLIGEGLEDDMSQVIIPNMMIKLKQAVGRLIRDISDYGVVTILDPRVFTNNQYAQLIRNTFESMGYKFTRSEDEVRRFFSEWDEFTGYSIASYSPYNREELSINPLLNETIAGQPKISKEVKVVQQREPEETITVAQWAFYNEICEMKGLSTRKPRGMKIPIDLYKHVYAIFYEKGESTDYVEQNFPYVSERQRQDFAWYKGQGLIKTTRKTPEEIEAMLAKYKLK